MKFYTDIHGAQRMNLHDFGNPLTFPQMAPAGHFFHLDISQLLVEFGENLHSWSPDDTS